MSAADRGQNLFSRESAANFESAQLQTASVVIGRVVSDREISGFAEI